MGFDQTLTRWRPLAKPGGYLAASELSWFRPDPPAEVKGFWNTNYPAMRGVAASLAAARAAGWAPVVSLQLHAEAWTRDYYGRGGSASPTSAIPMPGTLRHRRQPT